MDEQEQERAQQAIAEQLREERDSSQARQQLERPPRGRWPLGRRLTFTLVGLVVVIALLVPVVIFGPRVVDRFNALGTVTSFCNAASNGDYGTAYGLLSRRLRSEMTQDEMTAQLQRSSFACSDSGGRNNHVNPDLTINGDQAVANIAVNVTNFVTIGTMDLHRDSDGWRVDGIQTISGFSPF